MSNTNFDELLNAGCHFGHLTRKWNPKMAPYIFMERNDIHIIDLNKTAIMLDKASAALKQIAKSGRKILFVATKKQAKDIVAEKISNINMPYVTERWPGGMLTNFPTIRKAVKKMTTIDKMEKDGTFGERREHAVALVKTRKAHNVKRLALGIGKGTNHHRLCSPQLFLLFLFDRRLRISPAVPLMTIRPMPTHMTPVTARFTPV